MAGQGASWWQASSSFFESTDMALVEVKVPQLSESVAEATLLQWKKKVATASLWMKS
jgi:hypothetical protein